MIKIKQTGFGYCNNCKRLVELILQYDFISNSHNKPDTSLFLCEDCSNALSRLHFASMEDNKNFEYVKDEIRETARD